MDSRVRSRVFLPVFMLASVTGFFSPTSGIAATQGTAGPTSTGSITINASIGSRVSITHLTDMTFDDTDLGPAIVSGGTASKNEDVCVWSNNSDKGYFVTATGSGTSGAFTIANATNPVIPYGVRWAASTGQTNGTVLTAGTKSAKFISTATVPDCGGGNSASLIVRIQGTDASNMLASTVYTGTLTLLISPN
jgi:hypothetical protein